MPSLVIFLTVTIAVIVTKNATGSATVPDVDVAKLLDLVQHHINRRDSSDSSDSSDSDDSDSSGDSPYARVARVGENNVVDLIRQLIKSKNDNKGNHDHQAKEKPRNVARVLKYDKSNSKHDRSRIDEVAHILNQVLGNSLKKPEFKRQPSSKISKNRLIPNRLLWDGKDRNVEGNSLDEYSKIYIVLNPQAVQKTKNNKSSVNQLISKVLSLSSLPSNQNSALLQKPNRYKGFAIKEHSRRRGSREMYAPDDSMDDRPLKRGRNNGPSSGGHTAIPYIRHRGENIYEKDN